ncbi:MAG: hypothetical protein HKN68_22600 [Saprospiraceae bacterium]|nr:hypothetical protein [Saprospiraceae bacterium]
MRILTFIALMMFLALSINSEAQYDSGRITTIGFGAGDSGHAGSYMVEEDFRTKEFSGFRALVIEVKLGWNFWEMTSIYGVARVSPSNSIVSPYRSTYLGIGLSQALPFMKRIYAIGNYGSYRSSLGRGVHSGKGNLFNIGAGIMLDDNIFMEINKTFGELTDIDPDLSISYDENQWFGTISFRF